MPITENHFHDESGLQEYCANVLTHSFSLYICFPRGQIKKINTIFYLLKRQNFFRLSESTSLAALAANFQPSPCT